MNPWEQMTPAAARALQESRLRHFIRRQVYPYSLHYRRLFDERGIDPACIRTLEDLQRIPFSSKEDLTATAGNPQKSREFVLQPSPEALRRRPGTVLRALLTGPARVRRALEYEYRPLLLTSTTGRSADPVPFLYTGRDLDNLRTAGGRVIDLGSCTGEDRILNLFPYAPHLAYWLTHYAAHARNVFSVGTGGGKVLGTAGNLDLLEKVRPTILVGMPTFLYHLLHQGAAEQRRLDSLRCIVFGGEKVAPGTRGKLARMAAEMGSGPVTTLATYGFTEAKLAFPECAVPLGETPAGYHLWPDLGIVEIIDPESGEVQPEGHGGEIVFTPLRARGSVVLRYRTGDLCEGGLVHEPCPRCGRNVPRLLGRISRVSSIHSMQLHKLKGTLVDFNQLEHLLDGVDDVGSWQLELRKIDDDPMELDELVLHASLAPAADPRHVRRLLVKHFQRTAEVRPNEIQFHTESGMRRLHGVGTVLKEERIVDNRPKAERRQPARSQRSRERAPLRHPRHRRREPNLHSSIQ